MPTPAFEFLNVTRQALANTLSDLAYLKETAPSRDERASYTSHFLRTQWELHMVDQEINLLVRGRSKIIPPDQMLIDSLKAKANRIDQLTATSQNASEILTLAAEVLAILNGVGRKN